MTRRSFRALTASEAARRWRCSTDLVDEFLVHFAACGYVVKVGRERWQVTARGYKLACALSTFDNRVPA